MFKQKATPMFNNKLFKTGTILRMRKERKFHDSTTRLYKAALEMKSTHQAIPQHRTTLAISNDHCTRI
jgi:hypothetical protein